MTTLSLPDIPPVNRSIEKWLRDKLDSKTKPIGSLGRLEDLAVQLGTIFDSGEPELRRPAALVFAADHGAAEDGVSAYPQEVTRQMVLNFLSGGAAINVLARQNEIELYVVNAGVKGTFSLHPSLIDHPVRGGSRNYLKEPAMSFEECNAAVRLGRQVARRIVHQGSNLIVLGEMGIGNSSSAALLTSRLCGIELEACVGPGTGLSTAGLQRKLQLLHSAVERHAASTHDPSAILACFGGLELAAMVGCACEAAAQRSAVLVDGFISSAAILAASKLMPAVLDYCIFSHASTEPGHKLLLEHLAVRPLLQLDLRLGEGTGAAVALPIVRSAALLLSQMASFEEAGVSRC